MLLGEHTYQLTFSICDVRFAFSPGFVGLSPNGCVALLWLLFEATQGRRANGVLAEVIDPLKVVCYCWTVGGPESP